MKPFLFDQDSLGDIVYAQLPDEGDEFDKDGLYISRLITV